MDELKLRNYPLDPCLELCRKYKNLKGEAYLLYRSGASKKALSIYIEIFTKYYLKINSKPESY